PGEGAGAAVAGDLVVLYPLRRRDQGGVQDGRLGVLVHEFLTLFDQPLDRLALLAPGALVELLEDAVQAFHLSSGLFEVFLESALQLRRGGGLRHAGQDLDDLILGAVKILELVKVQVVQRTELHKNSSSVWARVKGVNQFGRPAAVRSTAAGRVTAALFL